MTRTETTAMLSKLVEKRLRNQTAFWASEVNFDLGIRLKIGGGYVGFNLEINGTGARKREKGCFVLRGQVMHG